jgi:hypothetical protein
MTEANASSTQAGKRQGLVCRHCGCRHFLTVYTRPRHDAIVRRKRCRHCGEAVMTREKLV